MERPLLAPCKTGVKSTQQNEQQQLHLWSLNGVVHVWPKPRPPPPSPPSHLTTAFTDSKTHDSVPKVIYIETAWTKWQMRHYTSRCQPGLYFHEFTSQPGLCCYDPFRLRCSLILCQRRASDKRRFITAREWGTSDTQSHSRRRWSLWPLTPLPRTDRQRHLASGSLYPALANNCSSLLASNCPLGLAFLLEHQSKEKPEQGEAASDSRRRVTPNIVLLWISAEQMTQRSRLLVWPPRKQHC